MSSPNSKHYLPLKLSIRRNGVFLIAFMQSNDEDKREPGPDDPIIGMMRTDVAEENSQLHKQWLALTQQMFEHMFSTIMNRMGIEFKLDGYDTVPAPTSKPGHG